MAALSRVWSKYHRKIYLLNKRFHPVGFDYPFVPCHSDAHTAVKEISRNFWATCPASARSERAKLDQHLRWEGKTLVFQ